MEETVAITKSECTSLCDFIELNLFRAIRDDDDIDNMTWLLNITNAFQRMAKCCNYAGYSYGDNASASE